MKNLNYEEMKAINGGNVPTAYYMDDDVINVNGQLFKEWGSFIGKVVKPFWKEIAKWAFLA
jgi:bacteriocin-like protein